MSTADIENDDMRFICINRWGSVRKEQWFGEITKVNSYGGYIELFIASRSSIRVICSKGQYSHWACIPDYQAGCVLSCPSDTFYNTERLTKAMKNKVDAITVAAALKLLEIKVYFKILIKMNRARSYPGSTLTILPSTSGHYTVAIFGQDKLAVTINLSNFLASSG